MIGRLLLPSLLVMTVGWILVLAPSAWSQPLYPSRPIRIIVQFSPGKGENAKPLMGHVVSRS